MDKKIETDLSIYGQIYYIGRFIIWGRIYRKECEILINVLNVNMNVV